MSHHYPAGFILICPIALVRVLTSLHDDEDCCVSLTGGILLQWTSAACRKIQHEKDTEAHMPSFKLYQLCVFCRL